MCEVKTKITVAGLICILLSSLMASTASAEDLVRLFGYVTDEEGVPISNIRVTVNHRDPTGSFSKNTKTVENGYYELIVPYYPSYDFLVEGKDLSTPDLFDYMPIEQTVSVEKPADMRVDFRLKPAANIIVHAYDSNGNLLSHNDFREVTNLTVHATGPNGLQHYAARYGTRDGFLFVVLPQKPYKLHILWEVPEFGKVILTADNEDKGYSIDKQGGQIILNFNYEAAKSKVAMLKKDCDQFKREGYVVSSLVAEGLKQSQEHLRLAEQYLTTRPSPDMRMAVQELNLSLKYSLAAHEQLYLDRAKNDIEKYRKGDLKIRVVDKVRKAAQQLHYLV